MKELEKIEEIGYGWIINDRIYSRFADWKTIRGSTHEFNNSIRSYAIPAANVSEENWMQSMLDVLAYH